MHLGRLENLLPVAPVAALRRMRRATMRKMRRATLLCQSRWCILW